MKPREFRGFVESFEVECIEHEFKYLCYVQTDKGTHKVTADNLSGENELVAALTQMLWQASKSHGIKPALMLLKVENQLNKLPKEQYK